MSEREEWRAAAERMNDAMREVPGAFARLGGELQKFGKAMKEADEVIWQIACRCYLAAHDKLPGSDRTQRLRKKRRARVIAWFHQQLDQYQEPQP